MRRLRQPSTAYCSNVLSLFVAPHHFRKRSLLLNHANPKKIIINQIQTSEILEILMSRRREEPFVKIIVTQFVETDPSNFKSVVQKLTGKDSTIEAMPENLQTGWSSKAESKKLPEISNAGGERKDGFTSENLWRGEFESFTELPPLDDLGLWSVD